MAKIKEEQILIQNGNQIIELTGADKEGFVAKNQGIEIRRYD